jgi:streptogramin lyase
MVLAAAVSAGAPLDHVRRPFSELKPQATLHVGKTADWIQIAGGSVWVGASGPNAISRIDPKTNRVTATVALPGPACAGMTSGFGALWAPICGKPGGLAKIDLATGRLAAVFPVGPGVREGGIAASPDSLWLPGDDKGHLLRIDPNDGHVRQTVDLCAAAENPAYAAGFVWVTCSAGASAVRIAATTGRVAGQTPTGPHPRFLAADRRSVWTLNQGDGSVTRIDPVSGRLLATIRINTAGHGGDIQLGGGRVWTTLAGTPLSLIDPASNRLERQWVGAGGDSLNYGFGSLWLTNYDLGLLQRFPARNLR